MAKAKYSDYEIIGYNPKTGSIVQWDATGDTTGTPCAYEPGETPAEYGLHNIYPVEIERLLADGCPVDMVASGPVMPLDWSTGKPRPVMGEEGPIVDFPDQ